MNNIPKQLKQSQADAIEEGLLDDMSTFQEIDDDYNATVSKYQNILTIKISDLYGHVFIYKREWEEK